MYIMVQADLVGQADFFSDMRMAFGCKAGIVIYSRGEPSLLSGEKKVRGNLSQSFKVDQVMVSPLSRVVAYQARNFFFSVNRAAP